MQENKHSVTIEQRKNIAITAVESVVAFSEVKIVLSLLGEERMSIIGTDLKIIAFSKTTSSFLAEGKVTSILYHGKSIASRIFK